MITKLNFIRAMSACLVFSLYTITNSATAQLLGYGNGQVDLPVGKGTVEYIDKHRGAIQSINTTGPNDVITLDPNNKHGVVNGQVLIIQMTGGNPGVHEGHTVLANNNGTITLLGKLVNTYSTSPGDKVQIIKVAEYKSVTLDGGIITCRAWDGHTGGILSMMVKEDFEVTSKGGMVLASGKGFLPEGVTWGTGGSGSAGSTNVGTGGVGTHGTPLGSMGGGIGPCNLPACIQGSYGVQIAGFDGGQGMNGGASGSAGTQTSGTGITYQGSNLNSRFMLGNPGYYQSGHGGGKGGDGGGPGAGGGASKGPQGANGSNGQVGEDGGTGGEPGKGAAGGGSIYIKAGNFDFSAYTGNKPIFYADGAQGAFGEKGELGSAGGLGGYGGKGYCSGGTFYRSGGTGGFGVAGTGANGGDGGNGGHPGYIWLIQEQAPFNSITSSVVSVRGGKGGAAGPGNYPSHVQVQCPENQIENLGNCNNQIIPCILDVDQDGAPDDCKTNHVCDCERAYTQLALSEQTPINNVIDGRYEFFDVSGQLCAWYDYGKDELVGVELFCTLSGGDPAFWYYHCPLYDDDNCDIIFEALYNEETDYHEFTYSDGNHLFTNGTGAAFEFAVVEDNNAITEDEKYFKYLASNGYIEHVYHPYGALRCYNDACDPSEGYGASKQGEPGDPGVAASNGTVNSNANANVPINAGTTSWKKENTSSINDLSYDALGLNVYPIPTRDYLILQSEHHNTVARVAILDVNSKQLAFYQFNDLSEENKIDLQKLPKGLFMLHVSTGAESSVIQIIKE